VKVVLFCGGQGLRARDGAPDVPKPLQLVGDRPLLWHVMTWYSHWGHRDFILCTGYRAEAILDWFLEHAHEVQRERAPAGQVVLRLRGGSMDGWRVTFADTGVQASVGMRLRAVRPLLEGEEVFLANYADTLCDVSLPDLVETAVRAGATATFLAVRPNHSFHVVELAPDGHVTAVTPAVESDQWINGGYFVLRREVFDVLEAGEELVEEPFARLIEQGRLLAHRHVGFWAPLDTAKDRHRLESLYSAGERPWMVWEPVVARRPA
jgi:glucose-1-phosphate cytidylyltransferase